ncbi:MAG: hypothetical protein ACE3JP_01735 [Ectobacillus sp.]
MKVIPKDSIVNELDQLLSALDLFEMNMALRVNHALKHKEDDVVDGAEIIHVHVAHMESRLNHHLEEGNWLKNKLSLDAFAVI